MSKMPRIVAIVSIVAGAIMIVVGVAVYFVVQRELAGREDRRLRRRRELRR